MLELYFIFYRIPKMMTQVARARHRSALAWSLFGIGTWIAAEMFVMFTLTMIYQIGVVTADWPDPEPAGLRFLTYLLGLTAALLAVTWLRRRLADSKRPVLYPPPPPPTFSNNPNG